MTDREKLYDLIADAENKLYKEMPFHENSLRILKVVDHLIAHGVTVQEPQKPLTVEDAREMPDVVWVEWSFGGCEPKIPSTIDKDTIHNIEHYSFTDEMSERLDEYGKTWRCWAKCPTGEERRNAKWEVE